MIYLRNKLAAQGWSKDGKITQPLPYRKDYMIAKGHR